MGQTKSLRFLALCPLHICMYIYIYIHAFRKQPTVGQTKGLRLLPHRLETTKPGANKNVKVFGPLSEANIYIYMYIDTFRKQPRLGQTKRLRFLVLCPLHIRMYAFRKQPTVGRTKSLRCLPHLSETIKDEANETFKVFGPLSACTDIYTFRKRPKLGQTKRLRFLALFPL